MCLTYACYTVMKICLIMNSIRMFSHGGLFYNSQYKPSHGNYYTSNIQHNMIYINKAGYWGHAVPQGVSIMFYTIRSIKYLESPGPHINTKTVFAGIGIPFIKMRWTCICPISIIEISILVRWHLYIEITPCIGIHCTKNIFGSESDFHFNN